MSGKQPAIIITTSPVMSRAMIQQDGSSIPSLAGLLDPMAPPWHGRPARLHPRGFGLYLLEETPEPQALAIQLSGHGETVMSWGVSHSGKDFLISTARPDNTTGPQGMRMITPLEECAISQELDDLKACLTQHSQMMIELLPGACLHPQGISLPVRVARKLLIALSWCTMSQKPAQAPERLRHNLLIGCGPQITQPSASWLLLCGLISGSNVNATGFDSIDQISNELSAGELWYGAMQMEAEQSHVRETRQLSMTMLELSDNETANLNDIKLQRKGELLHIRQVRDNLHTHGILSRSMLHDTVHRDSQTMEKIQQLRGEPSLLELCKAVAPGWSADNPQRSRSVIRKACHQLSSELTSHPQLDSHECQQRLTDLVGSAIALE